MSGRGGSGRGWMVEAVAVGLALLAVAPLLSGRTYYLDDVQGLGLPLAAALQRALKSGTTLAWNPAMFAGYSGLAAGQSGTYYPLNHLLYRLFPLVTAFSLGYIVHLWLLARGMLGLALELGYSLSGATATAAVVTLGGATAAHTIHYNVIVGMAWTAPILWLAVCAARSPRGLRPTLLLGAAIGLSLLQSHPQYVWLALLGAVCTAPWLRSDEVSLRTLAGRFGGAGLIGALLACGQLLPLAEYVHEYPRYHPDGPFAYLTAGSFEPRDWLRLLAPDLFGSPIRGDYDATAFTYWETRGFFGTPFLILALAAAFARPRDRSVRAGVCLCLVALALMPGKHNPLYRLLVYLPPFSVFRAPGRLVWLLQVGVGLLAGSAVTRLGERGLGPAAKIGWLAVAGGWLLAIAVAAMHGTAGALLDSAAPWLAALGLVAAAWGLSRPDRWSLVALLAVGLVELTVTWHSYAVTAPRGLFEQPPPLAAPILASEQRRTLDIGLAGSNGGSFGDLRRLVSNVGVIWGIGYLRGGREALMPTGHLAVLRDLERAMEGRPALFEFLCDQYSVRWVVTSRGLAGPTWRLAAEDAGARLYENLDARPFTYAVPERYVAGPGVRTWSEDETPIEPVEVLQRAPGLCRVRTRFDVPMAIVYAESMYPGWMVFIDGRQGFLTGAERIFMSAVVPPGAHLVEFRFDNAFVYLGGALGRIAWLLWVIALLATLRRAPSATVPLPVAGTDRS